jgi:hypothetical protein
MPAIQSQKRAAAAYFNSAIGLRGGATRLCRVDTMLGTPAILAAMAA